MTRLFGGISFLLLSLHLNAQYSGIGITDPTHLLHIKAEGWKDPVRFEGMQAGTAAETHVVVVDPATGVLKIIPLSSVTGGTASDNQQLSLAGNTLSLERGGSVSLAAFSGANTDEQDLSLSGNTLSLSNDATTVDLSPYLDAEWSPNSDDDAIVANRAATGGNVVLVSDAGEFVVGSAETGFTEVSGVPNSGQVFAKAAIEDAGGVGYVNAGIRGSILAQTLVDQTSDNGGRIFGIRGYSEVISTNTFDYQDIVGADAAAFSFGTGTVSTLVGSLGSADNKGTGHADDVLGAAFQANATGSGTVTRLVGGRFTANATPSATVDQAYGIFINDVADGTTSNYAVYAGVGNIRLGDLSGVSTRMVVADANGVLATQAIPSFTNTDNQTLYVGGGNLSISGGNSVALSSLGDDLGDHVLDRSLIVGNNFLSGDGDAEGIRVGTTGNIGINTISRSDGRITAIGADNVAGLYLTGEDNIWFDGGQVRMTTHDGFGNWQIKTGADNDDVKIGSGPGAIKLRMDESGFFRLQTQGGLTTGDNISWNDGLVINADGEVGIGTDSPNHQLHVAGDARIDDLAGTGTRMVVADGNGLLSTQAVPSFTNTDNQAISRTGNTLSISGNASTVSLASYLDNTDAQTLSIGGGNLSISGGNSVALGDLGDDLGDHVLDQTLETNGQWINGDNTANEGLFVNPSGYVGIGTATPTEALEIHGRTDADLDLYSYGSDITSLHIQSAAGTQASPTALSNKTNGNILNIEAAGYDGSNYRLAAGIRMGVSSTAATGVNDMPGRISLLTSPDGSASLAERLAIDEEGQVRINGINALAGAPSDKVVVAGPSGILKTVNVTEVGTSEPWFGTDDSGVATENDEVIYHSGRIHVGDGITTPDGYLNFPTATPTQILISGQKEISDADLTAARFHNGTVGGLRVTGTTGSSTANLFGANNQVFTAPGSAADLASIRATASHAETQGSGDATFMYGSSVASNHMGSGTIGTVSSVSAGASNFGAGTVSQLNGVNSTLSFGASSETTTAYGFHFRAGTYAVGATINDAAYGLYLGNLPTPTDATRDYGVYQVSPDDDNFFAGRVGIGVASPLHTLHVAGDTRIQDLAGTGNRMVIADATGILATQAIPSFTNTDAQAISRSGNTLSITGNASTVNLSPYLDNTDNQGLSLSGNTLQIQRGSNVDLTPVLNGARDNLGNHNATTRLNMGANAIQFANDTRQKINLHSTAYGLGVQGSTQYFRSGGNFAWFRGGAHNNAALNSGGGATAMTLDASSNLVVTGNVRTGDRLLGSGGKEIIRSADNWLRLNQANQFANGVYTRSNFRADGAVTFNEGSTATSDFRVESDGDTHQLFVDASTNRVGIGTNAPSSTLHVDGTARIESLPAGAGTDQLVTTDANGNLRRRPATSVFTNTDAQAISRSGNTLSITGNASTVSLAPYLDNTDAQAISRSGNTLSITGNASTVSLATYLDNTDSQTLSVAGGNLSISGGNSVTLASLGDDLGDHTLDQNLVVGNRYLSGDGGNEGIRIGTSGHIGINTTSRTDARISAVGADNVAGLYLTGEDNIWFDGGQVRMTSHDGFGNWQIKTGADNDDIKIGSNSGAIKLRMDESGYFRLQTQGGLSNGDNISWNDGLVINADGEVGLGTGAPNHQLHVAGDARIEDLAGTGNRMVIADATGILATQAIPSFTNTDAQAISRSGNTLSITGNASTVSLAPYLDNTDAQAISRSGNTLSITGNASTVSLATYLDNTDSQTLSVAGGNLSISGGNSVTLASLGDNLGDHILDQRLRTNGNWINGDNTASEGLFVSTNGRLGIGEGSPSQLLDVAGAANIDNHLYVGPNAGTGTSTTMRLAENYSSNANTYQLFSQTTATGAVSASAKTSYGAFFDLVNNKTEAGADSYGSAGYFRTRTSTTAQFRNNYGIQAFAETSSNATAGIGSTIGSFSRAYNSATTGRATSLTGALNEARGRTGATAGDITTAYGSYNQVNAFGADVTTAVGSYGVAQSNRNQVGDISTGIGVYGRARVDGDDAGDGRVVIGKASYFLTDRRAGGQLMTTAYAVQADANAAQTAYGVYSVADDGAATNNYAFFANAQNGSGNNYAFYSNNGGVRLGDLIGTGTRMVVADANGVLTTQAVPTFTNTDNQGLSLSGNTLQIQRGSNVDLTPVLNGARDNLGNHNATTRLNMGGNLVQFDNGTRQKINLHSTAYGLGVQSSTQYFRSGGNFAWFRGGAHNNAALNSGGGATAMTLDASSNLVVTGNVRTGDRLLGSGGKEIIRSADAWLRLNQANQFANGVYTRSNFRADGAVTFNEGSTATSDFRVESDGDTHQLFVDASSDRVGIGTNAPSSTLHVDGTARIGSLPAGAGTDQLVTADANGNLRRRPAASVFTNTDAQTLSVASGNLSISGGNSVALTSLGDNLGDHTLDQNLVVGTRYLSGDGGNEGIRINSVGHVGVNTPARTDARITGVGADDVPVLYTSGEDNIWFDSGQVRITTHDGTGNWMIKSGADNDDVKIGNGVGAAKFKIDENGTVSIQTQTGLTNTDAITWRNTLTASPLGRVGIGTTGPSRELHVQGQARVTGLGGAGTRMVVADANGNLSAQAIPSGGGNDNLGNHIATQNIRLNNRWLSNDGGNEGLRISNTGRIGVGAAADNSMQLKIEPASGITYALSVAGATHTDLFNLFADGRSFRRTNAGSATAAADYANAIEGKLIYSSAAPQPSAGWMPMTRVDHHVNGGHPVNSSLAGHDFTVWEDNGHATAVGTGFGLIQNYRKQGQGNFNRMYTAFFNMWSEAGASGTVNEAKTVSAMVSLNAGSTTYGDVSNVHSVTQINAGWTGSVTGAYRGVEIDEITSPRIANAYGIHVNQVQNASASNTGIYIEQVTGANATALRADAGNVVFNENGTGNSDLRVESDNNVNMLFVDASTNRVGIGKNNPSVELEVNGEILATGTITTSDSTLKTNVTPIEDPLAIVNGLNGVYYDWKADAHVSRNLSDRRQVGFLAQAVERVLPEAVHTNAEGIKGVDYGKVTPVLAKAIQTQQQSLDELRLENNELRDELGQLKAMVQQLAAAAQVASPSGR